MLVLLWFAFRLILSTAILMGLNKWRNSANADKAAADATKSTPISNAEMGIGKR